MSQQTSRRSVNRWVIAALVLVAVVIGAFFILKRFKPTPAASDKAITVRIGYLPIAADLPLFVANDQGYFTKHGIAVEMIRFESSPLMGTAFVNNSLDVAASISTTVALSTESRDPGKFRIFMVDANTPEAPLSAMLTMPGSGISRVEDLRNKKVGIFPGSNAALVFGLVFKKHGLDPKKDLTLIELPAGSQLQALEGKQIDALCTWEPIATQAVLDYKAVNFNPGAVEREVINPYNAGVWLLSSDFSRKNPDASIRLVEAFEEALDYMRNNPGPAKKALVTYASVAPHVADKVECTQFWKIGEVQNDILQQFTDIVQGGGVINKRIDAPSLLLNRAALSQRQ
jgi:ABC-type nitrate/sulfonate/bicarbonate transport system substrate-binding protein